MTITNVVPPEEPGAAGTVHVAPPVPSATAGSERSRALASAISRGGAVAVLILVLVAGNFIVPHFGSAANLRNTALSASFIAIIAAGMTFVIIGGGIDLSVGSVFALGVLTSAFLSEYGSFVAVVVPLLICGLAGLVQGTIIAYLGLPPFIVTLAGLLGIRGVVYYITGEGNLHPRVTGHRAFETLGQGSFLTIGYPIWITLAVFAVGWWLLNRTSFGQAVQAVGESETSARLMGLPVRRVTTTVYVISGALAGLAGVITTAQSGGGQEARIGDAFELSAIAAVVIGGTLLTGGIGSMVGTLAGAALLFVIQNLITQGAHAKPYVQLVIRGAFLLVVAVLQTVLSRRSQQHT